MTGVMLCFCLSDLLVQRTVPYQQQNFDSCNWLRVFVLAEHLCLGFCASPLLRELGLCTELFVTAPLGDPRMFYVPHCNFKRLSVWRLAVYGCVRFTLLLDF